MAASSTTTATAVSKTASILVLHGYGMTGASILSKTGALRSEVKKLPFEFFAIDGPFDCITEAPIPAKPQTPPQQQQQNQQKNSKDENVNDENVKTKTTTTEDDRTLQQPAVNLPANLTLEQGARAWYSFQNVNETSRYEKFDQGLQHIFDHCASREKQGLPPVKGIFAFSQGTIMATVIAARLEQEKKSPEKRGQLLPPVLSSHLEFVVLVSGLLPKDTSLRQEIVSSAPMTSVSSLHIVGNSDRLVDPVKTKELAELFSGSSDAEKTNNDDGVAEKKNKEKEKEEIKKAEDKENDDVGSSSCVKMVWEHEGGHVIPSQARKPFKAFLQMLMKLGR